VRLLSAEEALEFSKFDQGMINPMRIRRSAKTYVAYVVGRLNNSDTKVML
jgi:hypothetical protein